MFIKIYTHKSIALKNYLITFVLLFHLIINKMIISVTNLKGGVGKSTIAQNLAVCFAHMGYKVCIVDTDTNQTSVKWSSFRNEDSPSVLVFGMTEMGALPKMVAALNQYYEIVIIDGTPSLSKMTSKILLLSDITIIPTLLSGADFWAIEPFLERLDETKTINESLKAYILCNKHDDRINLEKTVVEALEAFNENFKIETLKTKLRQRVAYKEAMIQGLGVYELKDPKAKKEVVSLVKELEKIITSFK